jgi:hypothetical protein
MGELLKISTLRAVQIRTVVGKDSRNWIQLEAM